MIINTRVCVCVFIACLYAYIHGSVASNLYIVLSATQFFKLKNINKIIVFFIHIYDIAPTIHIVHSFSRWFTENKEKHNFTLRTGYWCVADGTGRKSVIKTRKKNYWNHSILFDNHAYYSCPWINQDGNWTNPLMTTILLKMLCCGRDTFLLPWTSKGCNFSEICFIKNTFV